MRRRPERGGATTIFRLKRLSHPLGGLSDGANANGWMVGAYVLRANCQHDSRRTVARLRWRPSCCLEFHGGGRREPSLPPIYMTRAQTRTERIVPVASPRIERLHLGKRLDLLTCGETDHGLASDAKHTVHSSWTLDTGYLPGWEGRNSVLLAPQSFDLNSLIAQFDGRNAC